MKEVLTTKYAILWRARIGQNSGDNAYSNLSLFSSHFRSQSIMQVSINNWIRQHRSNPLLGIISNEQWDSITSLPKCINSSVAYQIIRENVHYKQYKYLTELYSYGTAINMLNEMYAKLWDIAWEQKMIPKPFVLGRVYIMPTVEISVEEPDDRDRGIEI